MVITFSGIEVSHVDCNPFDEKHQEETRQFVKKIVDELGEDFVIAALVEGSIGYYSPYTAKLHTRALISNGLDFPERVMACFGGCAINEIEMDVEYLKWKEQADPESVAKLIDLVKRLKEVSSYEVNSTFSMMYPTTLI